MRGGADIRSPASARTSFNLPPPRRGAMSARVAPAASLALALAIVAAGAAAPAFADEPRPDPDRPYAPIYFDKPSYTWTDKVRITIVAPSWNANADGIDTIGGIDTHAVSVSTRGHELSPYRLVETGPGSGVFAGEVILTGFEHDADGDGSPDTVPRTMGSGPTGGHLQAGRDDAVTVSFEFRRNLVLVESAPVGWTRAALWFDAPAYPAGGDAPAKVSAVEPDMDLNPEAVDRLQVRVASDSDAAGTILDLIETGEDTGMFEGSLHVSSGAASGGSGLLRAAPGDVLTATYTDRTLPPPASASDGEDIVAVAGVVPGEPALLRAELSGLSVSGEGISMAPADADAADAAGSPAPAPAAAAAGTGAAITARIASLAQHSQDFVVVFQVEELGGGGPGGSGPVVALSWVRGSLAPMQAVDVSQSWSRPAPGGGAGPDAAGAGGRYAVQALAWSSLSSPVPLADPARAEFAVGP